MKANTKAVVKLILIIAFCALFANIIWLLFAGRLMACCIRLAVFTGLLGLVIDISSIINADKERRKEIVRAKESSFIIGIIFAVVGIVSICRLYNMTYGDTAQYVSECYNIAMDEMAERGEPLDVINNGESRPYPFQVGFVAGIKSVLTTSDVSSIMLEYNKFNVISYRESEKYPVYTGNDKSVQALSDILTTDIIYAVSKNINEKTSKVELNAMVQDYTTKLQNIITSMKTSMIVLCVLYVLSVIGILHIIRIVMTIALTRYYKVPLFKEESHGCLD